MLILLIPSYFSYKYYQEEKIGKKRYLESILKLIKFETLPKSGPRAAFIGKIAETKIKAFLNLDDLVNHTLIAGATGSGKTVTAQIIAEEALLKGSSVIVFDPTAQWTGFLRKDKELGALKEYGKFGMKLSQARSFRGIIYSVKDPEQKIEIKKHINPGEITIFCLNKLDSTEIESFIINTIDEVYKETLEESPSLKTLLIYDGVHHILPKFGGTGKGLTWLEKGVREFRKWGVGLILISQVLSDFLGEIKANIGTEIQLMTKYDSDLARIKLKYSEDIHKLVVKSAVGEGMIQNAEYNKGNPYFLVFRPPLHNLKRLEDDRIETYDSYIRRIDELRKILEQLKEAKVDVFDMEIELDLALDNLKDGIFGIVDLYLESLSPRINQLYNKFKSGEIKEEEKAIISEWDIRKEEELKSYKEELRSSIEKERERLKKKSEILKEKGREEFKRAEEERERLMEEEEKKRKEIEEEKEKLKKRSQVLDLLNRYKKLRDLLKEEVISKEWEKLREQKEGLRELKVPKLEQMKEERKAREEEINRVMEKMKAEEERISSGLKRVESMWNTIIEDEQMILDKDKEICKDEWELIERIKEEIQGEIEKRSMIKRELTSEQERFRREELEKKELERRKKFERSMEERKEEERKEREKIKKQKDSLYEKFKKIKQKWRGILSKEKEIGEKEKKIRRMKESFKDGQKEEEFRKFKTLVDELLEKLPPAQIQKFAKTREFRFYEKVISGKEQISREEKKKFISLVDKLLEKLPEKEIKKFTQDKEKYSLYQKIVQGGEEK